ncbi:hypothetical protein RHMOL_Rhmol10G0028200 [Rhododendron molle]|uniref:Uncharacterized protein n=1 Tax=Rhododendron molle TaxID=49168 RepID=A0ACC0LYU1_RHOML|nr:hypothetical protein RHMOL_Rhmol10G0028200 [Rhododendron molle]
MECNKDEAIRAKGIAEKKMQINDFEGARKIANKAQQLYPHLENIYQLIMVCNVHCSALNKMWVRDGLYYREHINRALFCQKCTKPFTAYDIGAQSVPLRSNFAQPPFPQQKPTQHQGSFNMGPDKNTGGIPPVHKGSQGNFSNKTMASKPMSKTGSTTEVGGGSTTKVKKDGLANNEGRKEGVRSAKVDAAKPKESRTSTSTNRKRRHKLVVESSEGNDIATSADTEEVVIQENGGSPAGSNSESMGLTIIGDLFAKGSMFHTMKV